MQTIFICPECLSPRVFANVSSAVNWVEVQEPCDEWYCLDCRHIVRSLIELEMPNNFDPENDFVSREDLGLPP